MGLESISNSELSLGLTLGAPVVKPGKNRRPWRLDDLRVPPAMAGNLQKWMFIIPYHKSPGSQKHIPESVFKALQTNAFLGRRQKSTFSVALGFPPWFSPFPPWKCPCSTGPRVDAPTAGSNVASWKIQLLRLHGFYQFYLQFLSGDFRHISLPEGISDIKSH